LNLGHDIRPNNFDILSVELKLLRNPFSFYIERALNKMENIDKIRINVKISHHVLFKLSKKQLSSTENSHYFVYKETFTKDNVVLTKIGSCLNLAYTSM